MTPILGIMASQISGHLFTPTGSMYHIATTTLSTTAASITFSSIAADYTHLQVRGIARSSLSATAAGFIMRVNSDSGSNYATHNLLGDGSITQGNGYSSNTYNYASSYMPAASATASIFGTVIMDILDYANTNKYKTMRQLYGTDLNGSGQVGLASGVWMNTNAITSITLNFSTSDLVAYTSFSLYGVK